MRRRARIVVGAALLAIGLVAGCGDATESVSEPEANESSEPTTQPTDDPITGGPKKRHKKQRVDNAVSIAYVQTAETVAATYLWKHALTDAGYQVELTQLDFSAAYPAIAAQEVDLYFGAWQTSYQRDYAKQFRGQLHDLGPWYEAATMNIAVPTYVKADSIADLRGMRKRLGGQIVGIESSTISTAVKRKVIPRYKLKGLRLRPTSTPAVLNELRRAIDAHQPIAVTLWHPHWAYDTYPIKDLADPKNTLGKPDSIHVIAHRDFRDEHEDLAKALADFEMDDSQIQSLMAAIQDRQGQPAKAVEQWAAKHTGFVDDLLE